MRNKIKAKSYKTLGKVQSTVIEEFSKESKNLFSPADVQRILGSNKNSAYQLLFSLKRKGWIEEIKKGRYSLLPMDGTSTDIMEIVTSVVWPSYISFWTALSYHKLTEQLPATIFLATTKRTKKIRVRNTNVQFIHLSPKRFFGYEKIGKIIIAEKEKSIIDCLLYPKYVGLDEVSKALGTGEFSAKKLGKYALRVSNKSLIRRLGYLLEMLKSGSPGLIKILQRNKGTGMSLLDPSAPMSKNYNKRWLLNINVRKSHLLYWKKIY